MMPLTSLKNRTAWMLVMMILASSFVFFIGAAGASPKESPYTTSRYNSGTPNSSIVVNKDGSITAYGNGAIIYTLPKASLAALGQALYATNCAACHGDKANGVPAHAGDPRYANVRAGNYPNLRGVGSAAVMFWITSGRMPAAAGTNVQAVRRPPRLTYTQALEVAAYIDSLTSTPGLPYVPNVNLKGGSLSTGASLYALNCAACHTITGDGDALASGTYAPSLRNVPANQVVEAIRTGPGNMPRFTGNLSDRQVRDIVKYVTGYIQHPKNPGGLGLGGLGPVAEGFVGLALGVGLLCLAAFWVGERQ